MIFLFGIKIFSLSCSIKDDFIYWDGYLYDNDVIEGIEGIEGEDEINILEQKFSSVDIDTEDRVVKPQPQQEQQKGVVGAV